MNGDVVDQIILPVYGKGLWSTMLGYLSVAPDGNTIKGLRFYAHAETPGLGDQIDKEPWRAQWVGKQVYGGGDDRRSASSRAPWPPAPESSMIRRHGRRHADRQRRDRTGPVLDRTARLRSVS